MDLLDEAVEWHRKRGSSSRFSPLFYDIMPRAEEQGLDGGELDVILKLEKESTEYPHMRSFSGFYDEDDWEEHECRHCDARDCEDRKEPYGYGDVYEDGPDDEDFDIFDDIDDPDDLFSDIAPEMFSLYMEMIGKHGDAYTNVAKMAELEKKDPELFERMMDLALEGPGDFSRKARKGKRRKR